MKGQVATEYLIVVSLAIGILLPIILWANQSIIEYKDNNKIIFAKTAVEKIGKSVDWVFSQGQPASLTIEVYIPEGIEEIYLANKTILFKVKTSAGISDVYYISLANVTGSIPKISSYYLLNIKAYDNMVNISV